MTTHLSRTPHVVSTSVPAACSAPCPLHVQLLLFTACAALRLISGNQWAPGHAASASSGCAAAGVLLPLHLSEQYFTSSHTLANFLRHVKGRPHVGQTLVGRSDLLGALDLLPAPFLASCSVVCRSWCAGPPCCWGGSSNGGCRGAAGCRAGALLHTCRAAAASVLWVVMEAAICPCVWW